MAPNKLTAEQKAAKIAEEERTARVARCVKELAALLERHDCTLQVQGTFVHALNGGPRQEVVTIGVIAR